MSLFSVDGTLIVVDGVLESLDSKQEELVLSPERIASTSGQTTGTNVVVDLPAREDDDYLILFVASNQAPTLTFTSGVESSTRLASAGSRLQAIRVVPIDGATQIAFTSSVSAVLTWWCSSWRNVDPEAPVYSAANAIGNSTTAVIESPTVDLAHISTGKEVFVRAASVNSTAVWTTAPNNIYATSSGNAAMAVRSDLVPEDIIALSAETAFNRGNDTVTRNESSLALILQPRQTVTKNRIVNGSFEAGGGAVATGWETEGTAPRAATYSRVAKGAVDGGLAQRMQFVGQSGDSGNIAIYQAPIDAQPGEVLRASIYLSGTLTNAYAIFGIEGFLANGQYIDEHDAVVTVLTETPTKYEVEYTCPPLTDYAAVYFQVPALAATSAVDVYLDKAILI